jgi:hypothetical protein
MMSALITGLCESLSCTRDALFWLVQAGYSENEIALCLKSNALAAEMSQAVAASTPMASESGRRSETSPSSLLDQMLLHESVTLPECGIILAGHITRQARALQVSGITLPEWLAFIGVPPHRIPYYLHGMQLGGLTLAVLVPQSDCARVSQNLGYWGKGVECHTEMEKATPYRFAAGDTQVSMLLPSVS